MQALDASSVIYAWDNYPERQFPPLWNWISEQIESESFVMAQVAFEEVQQKAPDCATFLKNAGLKQIKINNAIAQEAVRIKKRLGIVDEAYHPDGVSENDILIIASARIHNLELVTEEAPQIKQPRENKRLKIPRACGLPDVAVPCINFIELIRRSNKVFK